MSDPLTVPKPLDRDVLAEHLRLALRRFGAHTPTLISHDGSDLFTEDAEAVLGVVWPMLRALELDRNRTRLWNARLIRSLASRPRRKRKPLGRREITT